MGSIEHILLKFGVVLKLAQPTEKIFRLGDRPSEGKSSFFGRGCSFLFLFFSLFLHQSRPSATAGHKSISAITETRGWGDKLSLDFRQATSRQAEKLEKRRRCYRGPKSALF